jgi:hypothetical protein
MRIARLKRLAKKLYFLNQTLLLSDRSAPRVLSVYELLGGPVSRTRDKPVMCSVFLAVNPFPTPRLPSTKNNGENLHEMFVGFPPGLSSRFGATSTKEKRPAGRGRQGVIIRIQLAAVPIVAPPKASRSHVRPVPAGQQIIPFGGVVFNLGHGAASLTRGLLRMSRLRKKCRQHHPNRDGSYAVPNDSDKFFVSHLVSLAGSGETLPRSWTVDETRVAMGPA